MQGNFSHCGVDGEQLLLFLIGFAIGWFILYPLLAELVSRWRRR